MAKRSILLLVEQQTWVKYLHPPIPPQQAGGTDYDAIRRKIAEYKKKIEQLEKLLPNKR